MTCKKIFPPKLLHHVVIIKCHIYILHISRNYFNGKSREFYSHGVIALSRKVKEMLDLESNAFCSMKINLHVENIDSISIRTLSPTLRCDKNLILDKLSFLIVTYGANGG